MRHSRRPGRTYACPHELRRSRSRVRPQRPGGSYHLGAVGVGGARAGGSRAPRWRRGDRGAHAPGIPSRHVFLGVPLRRGLAGLRAHAARPSRTALDPSRRLLCPHPPRRKGCRALPRPRSHGREPRPSQLGRWRALARVCRAVHAAVRRAPPDDARRLPAGEGDDAARGRAGTTGTARLRPAVAHAGAGARRGAVRRRWNPRVAVRVGDALRRTTDGCRQRDRRRLPEPAGSRRGLAEPRGRGRQARRCARLLPERAGGDGAHRRDSDGVGRGARACGRRGAGRRRAGRRAGRDRRRDARGAREPRRRRIAGGICPRPAPLPLRPGHAQDRLGPRRPDSLERTGGPRSRHRPRGWVGARDASGDGGGWRPG